ncbi:MAG: CotH kinase family protein [Fibrobacteraceae bacterium]|nr:CotH kinase family protein [Fibrobacteraceae bacterium]
MASCSEPFVDYIEGIADETSANATDDAASSSSTPGGSSSSEKKADVKLSSSSTSSSSSEKIKDYLPINDTEYPYAGIPRIVIETEDHREIKDRETEIPAKLQIWGEKAPESEIMELTIRGRGNSTWKYPKKPYAIKFEKKQKFLGMPKAKKWVMLANYRDRTLIRNAVAFEIARQTNIGWTPQGKFADVFLNGKPVGNYYITEKIEIDKNRLNLSEDAYLLEFDKHYDEEYKFRTDLQDFPVNIKYPKQPTDSSFAYVKNYINEMEKCIFADTLCDVEKYIDLKSFVDYFIIYELAQNTEMKHPKSVYMHKESNEKLKMGPVWDFDWGTFNNQLTSIYSSNYFWYKQLKQNRHFTEQLHNAWQSYNNVFEKLSSYIDSLAAYTEKSNNLNIKIWPIVKIQEPIGDEDLDFESATEMLKDAFRKRFLTLNDAWG